MYVVDARVTLNSPPYIRPGARPYYKRALDVVVGITVHYTASSPRTTVWGTASYHVGPHAQEAFPAIAYHFFVDAAGTVYRCHDLDTRVWHSGAVVNGVARNASHIGICYAGNWEPSVNQRAGLRTAIALCEDELARPLTIEGHKDVYATSCPGATWPLWLDDITPEDELMGEGALRALLSDLDASWDSYAMLAPLVPFLNDDLARAAIEGGKNLKLARDAVRAALDG